MNRVVALGAALACALALSACEHETPGPAVEQAVGLDVDAPRVTLVSAGDGDKRVLAYSDIGQSQEVTVAVTEGFAQDVVKAEAVDGFRSSTVDETTTTLPLSAEVSEASAATEGQVEATRNAFFTAGVPQYSAGTDISSGEGFQFGWRAGDSGQVSSLRLAAPQGATDEARAAVEQAILHLVSLPVVFPTDAVGHGASWTVDSRVTGDDTLLQTATYTVTKIDGDTVELDVDVQQRPSLGALSLDQAGATGATAAAATAATASDAAAGETLDVQSATSTTNGSLTVDLKRPLPTAGSVDIDTVVVYGQKDSAVRVVQTTETGLRFSPS